MIETVRGLVWGAPLLILLLAAGILFTIRSGAFQIRGFRVWWRSTIGSLTEKEEEEIRPHSVTRTQAACTALAATIGTGNIVGVATALTAGGPGAIFWMWVSALIGMMTAYSETWLGIRYRYRNKDGRWVSGPAVYLARGLHLPVPGLCYGILCLMASLGMGSMVQSNAISQTLGFSGGISPGVSAVLVTAFTCLVIGGGISRIAHITEKLIPWAAGIYMGFAVLVLILCWKQVPGAVGEIFRYALLPEAVLGGAGGYGISQGFRYGISRGVFSNEAGLGSLAGLHGATENTTPEEQGMWAMFEVFFDTIVICTVTALVILTVAGGGEGLAAVVGDGAVLTAWCFRTVLGKLGEYLVSASMVVFAFATMIAWYFLGRQTLETVLEQLAERFPAVERWRGKAQKLYLLLYGYAVFLGCVSSLKTVWELSDIWNGLMAVPNLFALFFLQREIRYPDKQQGKVCPGAVGYGKNKKFL